MPSGGHLEGMDGESGYFPEHQSRRRNWSAVGRWCEAPFQTLITRGYRRP